MTTHTNDNGDHGPRQRPRLACLRRYCPPPAPLLRRGLTARQSGELERIAARYGKKRRIRTFASGSTGMTATVLPGCSVILRTNVNDLREFFAREEERQDLELVRS
jgi:hypothetical protein